MPEEQYLDPAPQTLVRDRGNVLSGWLIFIGFANAVSVYSNVMAGNFLPVAWGVFGLACVIGLWRWYRWAYYGLYLGFLFNIMLGLDANSLDSVMYGIIFIALTFALMQNKRAYLR
ncbi:MAG: hypothetical protein H6672_06090 [Anaerolineaceae bacterium]|nr:hypothetical protein [Anaerolineaceae bacterium]